MSCFHSLLTVLIFLLSITLTCESWSWRWSSSSSSSKHTPSSHSDDSAYKGSVAEFTMEGLNDQKAIKLVENAKNKLVGSNSCWQQAYRHLFAGCSEILAAAEKRSRFAWHLSDCFQKDSGRNPFPHCNPDSKMAKCLQKLKEDEHQVYLAFYLETNSICHQLQALIFKHETERLVNDLKISSQFVENKLEIMDEKSSSLLQETRQIFDSLNSIDVRTQHVAQTTQNVKDHIHVVLKHSELLYEQSKKIAASQADLQEGQVELKRNLEVGMETLAESYNNLGREIDNLREEAIDIEKEISKVGETMSTKMENLQSKADDIGNIAGISLDKQQELLHGQSVAMEGLHSLSKTQSDALEESRKTIQSLTEFGHRQQIELLQRQEQLQGVHDRLMDNSKSMLAAQESFESKQASMFAALDKLFALHHAMLLESRLIKTFFVYCIAIFVVYMFTSTKQTYTMRPWLYIGICVTLFTEVCIIRYTGNYDNLEHQTWLINMARLLFAIVSLLQILYAICTYRDYEILNHQILLTLIDKVNAMERHKEWRWSVDEDDDDDMNWSAWVDMDLPDDVNSLEDPDYMIPEEFREKSSAVSRRSYELRQRRLCQ